MFNFFLFKLSSNICNFCNYNDFVDFNHTKHQILFTQNNRFMVHTNVVLLCWKKLEKKLTFFKLVKSNSLTTAEKI